MTKIIPTIGRIVWYWPSGYDYRTRQPWPMTVCYVHTDNIVNLGGFDSYGNHRAFTSVQLIEHEADYPYEGGFCGWVPYEKGQAAKSKALETQLSDPLRGGILPAMMAPTTAPALASMELAKRIVRISYDYPKSAQHVTICTLTLDNGFVAIGKAIPASSTIFNRARGQDMAYQDALRELAAVQAFLINEAALFSRQGAGVGVPLHMAGTPFADKAQEQEKFNTLSDDMRKSLAEKQRAAMAKEQAERVVPRFPTVQDEPKNMQPPKNPSSDDTPKGPSTD